MKKTKNNQIAEEQIIPIAGDKVFTTSDLGIAAALLTADFELLTLDRTDPRNGFGRYRAARTDASTCRTCRNRDGCWETGRWCPSTRTSCRSG